MGIWNNHGMAKDDEDIRDAISILGLWPDEMITLVEHSRREEWVWSQSAKDRRGQDKRKATLIAKHYRLRMLKWIDLAAQVEMEYEEEYGAFAPQGK